MPAAIRPIVLSLVLAASAAAAPVAAASCPDESARAPTLSADGYKQAVLCLVNERRAQAGKGPVAPQSNLDRTAASYAALMVARGFFAHRSPSGRTPHDRVEASGYPRGVERWLYGENLGWGYGSQGTPLSIVEAWMNSPPHRENLLRGRFRDIGIGVVAGTPGPVQIPGAVTVTNVFGYRR